MKVAYTRVLLFVAGMLLLGFAILPGTAGLAAAAPPLVITETSTAEPPTPTFTSTPVTPTATPTQDGPTATPTDAGPTATPTQDSPTATPTDAGPTATPTDEPPPGSNPSATPTPSATTVLTGTPTLIADPRIVKTADRTELSVGDTVEFTLSVTNLGNATADDVVVEDNLPGFLSLEGVSASRGEVSVSGSLVRVLIGALEPGETVTVRITARVNALASPPDNANVGTVTTSSGTDDPSNNTSQVDLFTTQPVATPTPVAPASLPHTGAPSGPDMAPLIALGLALIAASLLIRGRRRGAD